MSGRDKSDAVRAVINKISDSYDVPRDHLILEEVDYFMNNHHSHGTSDVRVGINEDGTLSHIYLVCSGADRIGDKPYCPHNDQKNPEDFSIVYHNPPVSEMGDQAVRRGTDPIDLYERLGLNSEQIDHLRDPD